MSDKELVDFAALYRRGVHMATPVFDGASEEEIKHLIKMDNGYFSHEPISVASKNVMFFNFHPKYVSGLLEQAGFKVTKKLSVSNFRSPFLKRYIPEGLLNMTENLAQEPLARFNFGPSLFYRCVKASA